MDPSPRGTTWIVPTPLARDRIARDLALTASRVAPRVLCWDDLWRRTAARADKAPTLLSESAATAVFDHALRDETAGGRRGPLAVQATQVGYRRRLRRRFADWTAAERHRDPDWRAGEPEGDETIAAAERSTYRRYRRLLATLGAEDEAGLAVWASLTIRDDPRAWADADQLVFLDFDGRTPGRWRVLRDALERPVSVDATLCHVDDPARADLFLATSSVRDRLLELGLAEARLPSTPDRPAGLRALDDRLFGPPGDRVDDAEGLSIRGGPAGMDLGRMVAREAKALLDAGTPPDEILLVFPSRDDQSDAALEAMRAAGVPVADAAPEPLDRDPAIAAALRAARMPLEDWEVEEVVHLLRNGQVRPPWRGVDRMALCETASTLRDLPVFRGKDQILKALARAISRSEEGANEAETRRRQEKVARASRAYPIMEMLIGTIGPLDRPRPWAEHVAGFRRAVESLGIGRDDPCALETLWDALDDRAEIFERLGRGAIAAPWEAFVEELTDVVAETPRPRAAAPPGSIRAASVDEIEGVRAWHLLVIGLGEGSFPRRPSVRRFLALRPGEAPDDEARRAYSAEALRFARVLGAADRGASLFYPTTDAKGQPLLRAGFLDDLLGALAPDAASACHVAHARFHPALIDRDDLAIAPADARVLAVARAAESGRLGRLRALARDPSHRRALDGAAAAIVALDRRRAGTPFGPFEGLLEDSRALGPLADLFDPGRHVFSPSQLETYLNCPFQFFCRHVLKLEPIPDRDELDEDYTARGSILHDILEKFEKRRAEVDPSIPDEVLLAQAIDEALPPDEDGLGDVGAALRVIERGQVARVVALYARQRAEYHADAPGSPTPTHFEFGFGEPGLDHPEPYELRHGDRVMKLSGRVDRVDVIESQPTPRFRVLDYKSGTPPSGKDVTEYQMIQLPLYAMALEEILYGDGRGELMDVGYWGLKEKGYRPIAFPEWARVRDELRERVFAVIDSIQGGAFPIAPRHEGCEKYCDYRAACRVRQVRLAGKLDAARGRVGAASVGATAP
ncbi:PD-(D/E)XK nuclease family protein [Paludisphaera sp.]|uniref:PD-(D/E)XK nuclease family protein n=1 Tax=Paludisphaera sp. TaxID=2017432 RepID=UPI00301DCF7F